MRTRKWILILAAVVALILTGVYVGWRETRANERIRTLILAKARLFLAEDTEIQKVEMDLNNLHLLGVRLAPKDHSFVLEIDDVQLGFRWWNLIKYRLSLQSFTYKVVFVRPRLLIPKTMSQKGTADSSDIDMRSVFKGLETIKQITVTDAEVILTDSTADDVRLAHALNGFLVANPADSATVRLSGRLFDSETNNLELTGAIDLVTGRPVQLQVSIPESDPSPKLPFFLPSYITVMTGKIAGELAYDRVNGISGSLDIRDGNLAFQWANLVLENTNVTGQLNGSDLTITGSVERFNGSPLTISGKIVDVLNPKLDLWVRCPQFDVSRFIEQVAPESAIPVSGLTQFQLYYTGSMHNPVMSGDVTSEQLSLWSIDLEHFSARLGFQDSVVTLYGTGSQTGGLALNMEGRLNVSQPQLETSFSADLFGDLTTFFPDWSRSRLKDCSGALTLEVTGPISQLRGEAQGYLSLVSADDDTLLLSPDIWYADQRLVLDMQSNRQMRIEGEILSPFRRGSQWDCQLSGLADVIRPWVTSRMRRRLDRLSVGGTFSGTPSEWTVWLEGTSLDRQRNPQLFEAELGTKRGVDQIRRFTLNGTYLGERDGSLPFYAEGSLTTQALHIVRGGLDDFASFKAQVPWLSDGDMAASIRFSDWNLEKLHAVFPQTESYFGTIRGLLNVNGTQRDPEIMLDLALRDGRFHGVDQLEADLFGQWENDQIQQFRFESRKADRILFSGEAAVEETGGMSGSFSGQDIPLGELILAVTGQQIVTGRAEIAVQVDGTGRMPVFTAHANIGDGVLGSLSFTDLQLALTDTLFQNNRFAGGRLSITDGMLRRSDSLVIRVVGEIPHGPDEADIRIAVDGNLLGLLSSDSGLVRRAQSRGHAELRWAGRPGDWVLGSGFVKIASGEMELISFVDHITNIEADAEIHPDERFVQIYELSGQADGGAFSISTQRPEEALPDLAPLTVDFLGADLGVLLFETSGKGIRVHLPGLMENKENGWIAFSGPEGMGPFQIAGPSDHPLFRGTLTLTDNRITYPFLDVGGEGGTSSAIAFLEKVNWDIHVVPDEDVHYVRSEESPFGNVYVDLQLRNGSDGLYVSGIPEQSGLEVWGRIVSNEGSIDILDRYFRPEDITFEYPRGATDPILSGRAYTTVADSLGMPSTVWLTMGWVDDDTGIEHEGGPWGKLRFHFSTDNPNLGRTEADLLAALGYSGSDFTERAYDALGMRVENWVFRPIFRPIERGIRRYLGLDVVRVSSMFSRNLVQSQTYANITFDPRFLLRSTRLTLGKYLAPGLFLLYSGQVHKGIGLQYPTHGLGYRHAVTLEYTIRPDLFLEMEYTYDTQLLSDRREDKRIWLRHVFPF